MYACTLTLSYTQLASGHNSIHPSFRENCPPFEPVCVTHQMYVKDFFISFK